VTAPAGVDTPEVAAADPLLVAELDRVHGELREELGRANTTALGLAGTVATLAAVGLAALIAGQWSPARLPGWDRALCCAGVTAAAAGLGLLGAVALPRMPPAGRGVAPTSWGAIAACRTVDALTAGLRRLAHDPTPRVAHARELARIVRRKWRRIRAALTVLSLAAVLLTATTLGAVAAAPGGGR
jgi:hypothetical protein